MWAIIFNGCYPTPMIRQQSHFKLERLKDKDERLKPEDIDTVFQNIAEQPSNSRNSDQWVQANRSAACLGKTAEECFSILKITEVLDGWNTTSAFEKTYKDAQSDIIYYFAARQGEDELRCDMILLPISIIFSQTPDPIDLNDLKKNPGLEMIWNYEDGYGVTYLFDDIMLLIETDEVGNVLQDKPVMMKSNPGLGL